MTKMTPEQFTYWLNGFFELSGSSVLDSHQVKLIRQRLDHTLGKTTMPDHAKDQPNLPSNPFQTIPFGLNQGDHAINIGAIQQPGEYARNKYPSIVINPETLYK